MRRVFTRISSVAGLPSNISRINDRGLGSARSVDEVSSGAPEFSFGICSVQSDSHGRAVIDFRPAGSPCMLPREHYIRCLVITSESFLGFQERTEILNQSMI